jgi:tetratricopeptide (TPR) repeat protein
MELEDRITEFRRVLQERLETAIERARTHAAAPKPIDRQREALRLNATGARLRREGAYDDAAEQHRQALTLFHELGDPHSEALTLNNLALALDHAGDETALELFEQAATTLGDLGDEQHEGQVIANLALAFRRRGETEKSEDALDTALMKLRPESDAYRKVQSLKRAS